MIITPIAIKGCAHLRGGVLGFAVQKIKCRKAGETHERAGDQRAGDADLICQNRADQRTEQEREIANRLINADE